MTSGHHHGSISFVVSHDLPLLSSAGPPNAPATGKTTITLAGVDFHFSASGRLAFTSAEASIWVSDTAIACKSTTGTNPTGLGLVATAGGRVGSLSESFTFNSPISSFHPANQATAGARALLLLSLTVHGSDFGTFETSVDGRVGHTNAESSHWAADTTITSRISGSTLPSLPAAVTVSAAVDSATQGVSFDLPAFQWMRKTVRATGEFLSAAGRNMGTVQTSPHARLSSTACESTDWVSDTMLIVKMRNSTRGPCKLVATVSTQVATHTGAYYDSNLRIADAFGK